MKSSKKNIMKMDNNILAASLLSLQDRKSAWVENIESENSKA